MLFNSHFFIFLFLPVVLGGYYGLRKLAANDRLPIIWLLALSVFFYGWWEARYIILLAVSVFVNYNLGGLVLRSGGKRGWLVAGVVFNLGLLAWFKYAYFIVDNLGRLAGLDWTIGEITLPLAISFFTFQQIAWLVDVSKKQAGVPSIFNYALFVSFFPQLIAGPIVHHSEMMPQFEKRPARSESIDHLNIGLTIFAIGLFKKVVLADQFAVYANPVFEAAGLGLDVSLVQAWVGTISYTFQLYFDFSGYSDMAVGLARMMGIVLPLNFFSPYKAGNIREFWQRWHITLSRFLRDYLYIPLGGNRARSGRVMVNIMITMLIGGLWHGAAWTFVAWGGLHGFYLLVHRTYSGWRGERRPSGLFGRAVAVSLTFIAVMLGWVLFRAESFNAAMLIYQGMAGLGGLEMPSPLLQEMPELPWLLAGAAVCFLAPNTYEFMAGQRPALIPANIELKPARIAWRGTVGWALVFAGIFTWSVLSLNRVSEFLYFQF